MDETIYAQKRKNLTDAYERQRAQNERQWAKQRLVVSTSTRFLYWWTMRSVA